jgi:glutamate synthase (NADPH/NADH) large chain
MVDIDPILVSDLDQLHAIVSRHLAETDSAVAAHLLSDWERASTKFIKVFPKDYKRVLEATARAEAAGLDVVAAVMEAARG